MQMYNCTYQWWHNWCQGFLWQILWSLKSLSLAVVKGGLAAPRGRYHGGRPTPDWGFRQIWSGATFLQSYKNTPKHIFTSSYKSTLSSLKKESNLVTELPHFMKVRWKVCKIELHIFTFLKKEWFLENISVSQAFPPSSNQVEEGEDWEFCILGSFQFRKLLFSRYTPQHPIGDCLLNNIDERKKMI